VTVSLGYSKMAIEQPKRASALFRTSRLSNTVHSSTITTKPTYTTPRDSILYGFLPPRKFSAHHLRRLVGRTCFVPYTWLDAS
jgi:hypothetical protein